MSNRRIAKSIEKRCWTLKDRLIAMSHQARDAGLTQLAYELSGAFMQMDEVINEAHAAAEGHQ